MYALPTSAEGACYLCVPPNPGIESAALGAGEAAALGAGASPAPDASEAAALGASESTAPGAGESALSDTAPTAALHTFTLDSGASRSFFRDCTTLLPLSRPMAVSMADPSGGPVLAHSFTVLPCPAVLSGSLPGLHLPSFSTNLVSGADLQHAWVDQFTPGACVRGQGNERYFLLVVDDYLRYTTVSPLRCKGEVTEVLIDWIRVARRHLSESFGSDLPILHLHSERGGEFSFDLLQAFCRVEGIRQTLTLPASPQQNGIAERRTGMVMDVARTSMIHAAAPHFLWPFAVQYAAHQLNLQPRVSMPETTPIMRWKGRVGDASAFRVWGSRAFVRDLFADKLSSRAVPCGFLSFPPNAPCWQFYHPTSRRVLSSQDVTFDESVPYYHLFPYRTAPLPPPHRSSSHQVPCLRVLSLSVRSLGVLSQGVLSLGVLSLGVLRLGVLCLGVLSLGLLSLGVQSLRVLGLIVWSLAVLSLEVFHVLRPGGSHSLHVSCSSGLLGAGAVLLELVALRALEALLLLEVLLLLELLGVLEPQVPKVLVLEVLELLGLVLLLELELLEEIALAVLLGQVLLEVLELELLALLGLLVVLLELELLEVLELAVLLEPVLLWVLELALLVLLEVLLELVVLLELELPLGVLVLSLLVPEALSGHGRTTFRFFSRFCSLLRVSTTYPVERPPPVPGMHRMALRPSTAPQCVPLPSASSLPAISDLESDSLRAASPTATRLMATVVTHPSFESTIASALVAEFVDRQEEFVCFEAAVPHLVSMLIAPEGDPDAPDILTPRSYAEAIEGPYSSQWQ
ncbi:unnamed protein product [Closterium sp. NIES-64]|nr:unnamed protein product [Closterium sp. NIES-64]